MTDTPLTDDQREAILAKCLRDCNVDHIITVWIDGQELKRTPEEFAHWMIYRLNVASGIG